MDFWDSLGFLEVRVDGWAFVEVESFGICLSLCLSVARAAAQASVRHVPALVQGNNVGTVRRAAIVSV